MGVVAVALWTGLFLICLGLYMLDCWWAERRSLKDGFYRDLYHLLGEETFLHTFPERRKYAQLRSSSRQEDSYNDAEWEGF